MVGSSVVKILICCSVVGESGDVIVFDCSVVMIVDGFSVVVVVVSFSDVVVGFSVVSYSLYSLVYAKVVNCSVAD